MGLVAERGLLSGALAEAQQGHGSTWVLEGPAGIGKTRLARWVQQEAGCSAYRTLWGYSVKEVSTPFFPFLQIFRTPVALARGSASQDLRGSPVVIIEEPRTREVFDQVGSLGAGRAVLVLSRERPETLKSRYPSWPEGVRSLWLSKGEGPEKLSPTDIDHLGNAVEDFLRSAPGSLVTMAGIEFLVTQNGFPPVLRLVQFVRDVAEETGGQLLISVNPESLERREVSLLEGEGEVHNAHHLPEASPTAPETGVTAMMRYLDELEGDSAVHPILLVFDDLPWADPDSLRTFQFLSRNVRDLRVVMVATARTDLDPTAPGEVLPSWRVLLDDLEKEGSIRRIALHGLGPNEAVDLVEKAFGGTLPSGAEDPVLRHVLERSGGNAYFLLETLRQLAERSYLHLKNGGLSWNFPPGEEERLGDVIPDTLRRLVGRRLEPLHPDERELLQWAAVCGSEFDTEPLAAMLSVPRSSVERLVERIEHREHLVERTQGTGMKGRWAFGHPFVWEVVSEGLPMEAWQRHALALAEWWSMHRPEEREAVARLYHEAKVAEPGLAWVRKALQQAVESRNVEAAERLHRWLQDLLEVGGIARNLRVQEGLEYSLRLLEVVGPAPEVERILRGLMDLQPPNGLRWEVEACRAFVLAPTAPRESHEIIERIRAEWTGHADLPKQLLALAGLAAARSAAAEAREEDVEREADGVIALGRDLPEWIEAQATYLSGGALAHRGTLGPARERLARLKELSAVTGNVRTLADQANLEIFIAEATGDVIGQCHASERRVELARRIGNPASLVTALSNLSVGYVLEGDLDGAKRTLAEFRQLCHRFRFTRAIPLSRVREADIALHERRWKEACDLFEEAEQQMIQSGDLELLLSVRLSHVDALLCLGDLSRALSIIATIRSSEQDLRISELASLLMLEGRVLLAQGEREGSRQKFDEALAHAARVENSFDQGMVERHLAQWEERFGNAEKAQALRASARARLVKCGIAPKSWAMEWPPPFPDAAPRD